MNWTLLHKYLTEECDPEEMQRVEAWFREDERNRRFFETLVKIWEIQPADEIEVDSKQAWENFQKKMPGAAVDSTPAEPPIFNIGNERLKSGLQRRKRYVRTVAMALSAAAVLVIAFLFYQYMPGVISTDEDVTEGNKVRQIVTERGQRTNIRLLDGTSVQLNSNSKIEIPPTYNDSVRIVQLEGEGFFEVASDSAKPFIVQSGETYTRVLGTKFGVRTYSGEGKVQVVVAEGKVAMGVGHGVFDSEEMFIAANQKGSISKYEASKTNHVKDLDRYLGWKDGKLVFNDTPLGEVVPELERWYDVEIRLEDSSIKDLRFNASFQNESLTEVMNVLALSLDLNYNRKGRTIVFSRDL